jgi:hypothetical protein
VVTVAAAVLVVALDRQVGWFRKETTGDVHASGALMSPAAGS